MTSSFLRVHSFSKAMNKYNLGKNLLFAGCFLLPTSGYIGPFLILLACICGSSLQGFKALFVKKMYPLYVLSALILMSAFASPLACDLVVVFLTGSLSFGSFGLCQYTCEIKIISSVLL